MTRARHWATLLLAAGCVLALAACGGSGNGALPPPESPPSPAATPEPIEPPATATPVPPAETPQPPATPPEAIIPEPPAEPVAPAASSPPAASATSASEPAPAPRSFRYDTYDLSGAAAEPGHYAFLVDPADPASVVTTYEGLRDGTATALLIHTHDAHGVSQAAFYDDVEAGDIVEWREANDCFVRYPVTEVKDDPTGDPPRKLLAVKVMTYAFTGCSGAIDTTASPAITWAPANLRSPEMTIPVRHGPWQLMPMGWTGARETPVSVTTPGTAETGEIAEVRRHRLWREPDLPAGWRLSVATAGREGTDGLFAQYVDAEGYIALDIVISQPRRLGDALGATTADHSRFIVEARVIDGHAAIVQYSPVDNRIYSTLVIIYDAATGVEYGVVGSDPSLRGANIDATIAIARSLYRTTP